jgi:acetyl-CoA C-acetyltransferase
MHVTVEDVLNSAMLANPIKFLDMCPRSDGACAVIFASEEKAKQLAPRPARVHASMVRNDFAYLGDLEWTSLHTLESARLRQIMGRAGARHRLRQLRLVERDDPRRRPAVALIPGVRSDFISRNSRWGCN